MTWLIGPANDYDPEGRKHSHQAPNRWQQIQGRLDALKPGYPADPKARYILDRFQEYRDSGTDAEGALNDAEDGWHELERRRRDREDTGRWYTAPREPRVW